MNFIVGALLFHANEVMAFWLFVSLIEDCEMRDIYMAGLPGLFKHSNIINSLIVSNLPDLSDHFVTSNLPVLSLVIEWASLESRDVCIRLDLWSLCLSYPAWANGPLLQAVLQSQMGLLLLAYPLNPKVSREGTLTRRRVMEHSESDQVSNLP